MVGVALVLLGALVYLAVGALYVSLLYAAAEDRERVEGVDDST